MVVSYSNGAVCSCRLRYAGIVHQMCASSQMFQGQILRATNKWPYAVQLGVVHVLQPDSFEYLRAHTVALGVLKDGGEEAYFVEFVETLMSNKITHVIQYGTI